MARLLWDQTGERLFESGVDRGVLYLSDGSAVPWNGLLSVDEEFNEDASTPYFLDGVKYLDSQSIGDFSATIKALTYPEEFLDYEGLASDGTTYFDDQPPKPFGLSYRTRIGNDIDGTDLGYKIHVIYNLLAVQETTTYSSVTNRSSALAFSWKVDATPANVSGHKPTAHVIIDSRRVGQKILENLEGALYGKENAAAFLPSIDYLLKEINTGHLINIIDNGDGTWTASSSDLYVYMLDATTFEITQVDATYLDANTYTVSPTDTPQGA